MSTTEKRFLCCLWSKTKWNREQEELKQCPNLKLFKKRLKEMILRGYNEESVGFSLGVDFLLLLFFIIFWGIWGIIVLILKYISSEMIYIFS